MSEHRVGARVHARAVVLKTYFSSGVAVGALAAALAWPGSSQAACNTAGTTVTCSGTTTSFGTGAETGLTINVQNGATVSGAATGIDVGSNNTVNNLGSVSGTGLGISATTNLLVINGSATNSTASITGTNVSAIEASDAKVTNFGTISGGVIANVSPVNIDNKSGATISATGNNTAVVGRTGATVANAGMISAQTSAIENSVSGDINITSNSGTITTSSANIGAAAIAQAGSGAITVSNSGIISNTGAGGAIVSFPGGAVTITSNTGTISSANGGAISGGAVGVTNNGGGTISGTIGGTSVGLTNTGMVMGGSTGAVRSSGDVKIMNGTAGGPNTGVAISSSAITVLSTTSADITNFATISGNSTNGTINTSGSAMIKNSGTISGAGASNAVAILTNNALSLTNNNGATISGALDGVNQQGTDAVTINNAGMISGAGRSGLRLDSNASVTNTGTTTGLTGIVFRDATGTNTPVVNGSVFNSGTITGTGGVAINFAATPGSGPFTLTLGPGSIINGNVTGTGGDLFQLGGTGSDAFNLSNIGASAQYQGFTTFNKIDGSTWTVTGTGNQDWNVQAGTFVVSGTINGALNATGGMVTGTGAAGNTTIASGATLSPGTNGIGTFTVNGNLALQAGALYLVTVNPTTSGATSVTSGTAAIGGAAEAMFQGTNFQNKYTLISAAGGRTGTFDSFTAFNLPSMRAANLIYTPTEVDLILSTTFAQIAGLTGNQLAVAVALDRASNSGGFLSGLNGLTPAQIPAALDALSGQGTTGTQETALGAGYMFLTTMMDQGALWRDSEAGEGSAGSSAIMSYAAKADQHPALKAIPLKAPVDEPPRWRTWAAGFDGSWKLDGEAGIGSSDLSHNTAGGAAGIDYQINRDVLIGFAGGGSASSFSVPALATSGSVDGAHLGAYGVARWGTWYTAGALTGAAFDNRTSRTIAGVGPTELASASFKSDLLAGRVELGHKQAYDGFAVTPFAAVQFAELWQQGYSESSVTASGTPGVLGLTYQSHNTPSLPTFLGAQFDTQLGLPNGMLWKPYARVSWVHEFEPTRDITASFLTLANSAFTVDGPRAARDAARIDIGSKLAITRTVSLFGTFNGEFSDRSQLYSGSGGLRVVW